MSDTTPDPAEPADEVDAVDDAEATEDATDEVHGNTRHSTAGVEDQAESYGDAPHGAKLPAADFPNRSS